MLMRNAHGSKAVKVGKSRISHFTNIPRLEKGFFGKFRLIFRLLGYGV